MKIHVIFVHGLSGHIEKTWAALNSDPVELWPKWLSEDIEGLGLWLVGYSAAKTNWGGYGMPLSDRADNILARLLAEPRLTKGNIIFITHSLGGLVVEHLLRNAHRDSDSDQRTRDFLSRVKRVAFLGTPHRGAQLANIIKALSLLLRPTAATRDLVLGNPQLRDLNYWYRKFSHDNGIENLVLAEGRPERVLWIITLPEVIGTVVSPSSADAGLLELPIIVDQSHITISKPATREAEVYVHVREFIKRPFGGVPQVTRIDKALNNSKFEIQKLTKNVRKNTKSILDLKCIIEKAIDTPSFKDVSRRDTTISQSQKFISSPIFSLNIETARAQAKTASVDLLEWPRDIFGAQIERPELNVLRARISKEPSGVTLLIGEAGSGKSALLSTLTEQLEREGVSVLAIKADRLPASVRTIDDVAGALGMDETIEVVIRRLAKMGQVVLIIDQLDAVSNVMDRKSERMRLLLRLTNCFQSHGIPIDTQPSVHVIVSSRPFEADHDARFQQLGAERVKLSLPDTDQVSGFLAALKIDPGCVPRALTETIRRPFALKLFVGLIRRGIAIDDLLPGELLSRWLETADLGELDLRTRVIAFLTRLASDMIEAEVLWRPADSYEFSNLIELRQAQACGLIVRNDRGQIGFSHQSWLDDFQAKGFTSCRLLTDYAWQTQDSLFPRAAILRGLQRLRGVDSSAYLTSIDLLLGEAKTRRHLKHLVTDLISSMDTPLPREVAWIEYFIRHDRVLARRALPRVVRNWSIWRDSARSWIELLMTTEGMEWFATRVLATETTVDADGVMDLIDRFWYTPKYDSMILQTIEQSGFWTEGIKTRTREAMVRTAVDNHFTSHLMRELAKRERVDDALDFIIIFYETGNLSERTSVYIHMLGELAKVMPVTLSERLFPFFVAQAASRVEPNQSLHIAFDRSSALPQDWNYYHQQGSFFEILSKALQITAACDPQKVVTLLQPFYSIEIEQVQEMIANTLAAGGAALATEGFEFLITDIRRLNIGTAYGTDTKNTMRMLNGFSTQQLIRAIVSGLDRQQLNQLRDFIEGWICYSPEVMKTIGKENRLFFYRDSDEARFPLLEILPEDIVGARRRRQIAEWRSGEPLIRNVNQRMMASFAGSPMSAKSMERASDDQILGMLNTLYDAASDQWYRRQTHFGGIIELSRAFGVFAKAQPDRAMKIIDNRLLAGRHEYVAGHGIRELAETEAADPHRVRAMIHSLDKRGFVSETWRNNAAWAMSYLARRLNGLNDEDVALLNKWIVRDPKIIAKQIESRLAVEEQNRQSNNRHRQEPQQPYPFLFDQHGGFEILPHHNYTLLAAISDGLLLRSDPAVNDWASFMERHISEPEDPKIWATLLRRYGRALQWIDPERASVFFEQLWKHQCDVFQRPKIVGMIWSMRSLIPLTVLEKIITRWLEGDDRQRQAAGELVAGMMIADQPKEVIEEISRTILENTALPATRVGYFFSVAAAWREPYPDLRAKAHQILLTYGPSVVGNEAIAMSQAITRRTILPADQLTRDILIVLGENADLLLTVKGHSFLESLQSLLLHPGFETDVLNITGKLAALLIDPQTKQGQIFSNDLVHISVALQRSAGELRVMAMDVYEKLLDAEAYGSTEAGEAALARHS